MIGDIQTRLLAARLAVASVKEKLPKGPGNKTDEVVERNIYNEQLKAGDSRGVARAKAAVGAVATSFAAEASVLEMRILDAAKRTLTGKNLAGIERLREISKQAEKAGAGNCSDQACMAFVYLFDHAPQAARPIDLMVLTSRKHAFVALGIRVRHSLIRVEGVENPAMWGDEVVICDPWNNDSYLLDQTGSTSLLLAKMKCGSVQATSEFRAL